MGKFYYLNLVAEAIDIPYDQILLISTICSSIPIGVVNYFISNSTVRLIYGFVFGILLQHTLYGIGVFHALISAFGTWFFIEYYGRKRSPFWVFGLTFVYLSGMHLYRLLIYYGKWQGDDTTIIYMMTICKYSSMAFSYEDGEKEDKDIKNSHWRQ